MPVTRTCPGSSRNVLGASPRGPYACGPGGTENEVGQIASSALDNPVVPASR